MGRNTFCQEFEYGASAEGYCIYDRIVLQIEDCNDIIKALHLVIYFIFPFYYNCGNDKVIEYSLNVTKMKSGYDRAQR